MEGRMGKLEEPHLNVEGCGILGSTHCHREPPRSRCRGPKGRMLAWETGRPSELKPALYFTSQPFASVHRT